MTLYALNSPPAQQQQHSSEYGSDIDVDLEIAASDYGSEFDAEEESLIGDLLQRITREAPRERTVVYEEEGGFEVQREGEEGKDGPRVLLHSSPPSAVVRIQRGVAVDLRGADGRGGDYGHERAGSTPGAVEVDYGDAAQSDKHVPHEASPSRDDAQNGRDAVPKDANQAISTEIANDTRSPLARFRTFPKKPLSVTDLVSPAWCELQYWFNLTRFGRKPRTQAMKQGSKVHRTLEEQVHEFVPVQTTSKEDRFALKIWNTIQGLRTLRATGLTREMEVWGMLDGQVVNGVIDEVSFTEPVDPRKKDNAKETTKSPQGKKRKKNLEPALPPGQIQITNLFSSQAQTPSEGAIPSNTSPEQDHSPPLRTVYIADVKTRGAKSVPAAASLRPTWIQLMLYRKLLSSLADDAVDADTVFARYALQPMEPFTETFVSDVTGLAASSPPPSAPSSPDSATISELHAHRTLRALWSLMTAEFQHTFSAVSPLLRAEFRYARTGELIGSEIFSHDDGAIEEYVASEMSWWKGEREAVGVEVEEAFKCRMCDFAGECEWRKRKVEEATERHRRRLLEGNARSGDGSGNLSGSVAGAGG